MSGGVKKANRELPDDLKQSSVRLNFVSDGFPTYRLGEYYRIHLGETLLGDGEESFYRVEFSQPTRAGVKLCPRCFQPMKAYSETVFRCHAPECTGITGEPSSRTEVYAGPVRGVVRVLTFPEWDRGSETRRVRAGMTWDQHLGKYVQAWQEQTVLLTGSALLVLDRRYNERTLQGVYDAARVITEELGRALRD